MRACLAGITALWAISFGFAAYGADYKALRHLNAPPPTIVTPLQPDANSQVILFSRLVMHPQDGEPWAIAYRSSIIRNEYDTRPSYELVPWNAGPSEGEQATFQRAFDDELSKAGFKAPAESLFEENNSVANLKVGVLIDNLQGRFCVDCPSLFNPNGVPASVIMTAHWEIYSVLERRVVAKITTAGGADYKSKLEGRTFLPAVIEGFRENVRQLIVSEEFRRLATAPVGGTPAPSPTRALTPISLVGPKAKGGLADASKSVVVVFSDGSGSGFLVSADGYLITNQHVVGGAKYVKLKWLDGSETIGEVVRSDARRDVALVKTDARGRAPLSLRLSAVRQGEAVYAIGAPLGEEQQDTLTKGIVSATRTRDGLPYIQSDVAVTHGNSGGPLLDEKGAVIGLTVSGLTPNGAPIGVNFFIPIDDALKTLALLPPA